MTDKVGRPSIRRRTGDESFHEDGKPIDFRLLDFWRWSASDLVSSATRGRLAEFLVARAIGVPAGAVRDEWASHDLTTPSGIKVDVKSAAYVQSWHQSALSPVTFVTAPTRAWDADTNQVGEDAGRQADVCVFALLAHQDKPTLDPLNVAQWQFYVLSAATLDRRARSHDSITLKSLTTVCKVCVPYAELGAAIELAGAMARSA